MVSGATKQGALLDKDSLTRTDVAAQVETRHLKTEEVAMSLQPGKLTFGTLLLLLSMNLPSAATGCIGQCDSQLPACAKDCTSANRNTGASGLQEFAQSTDEQKRKWKDKQRDCVEKGNCPK